MKLESRAGEGFALRASNPGAWGAIVIRVVLVEDEMLVRSGIRGLLSLGPNIAMVAEAADGEEAVSDIRYHRPDVVLL